MTEETKQRFYKAWYSHWKHFCHDHHAMIHKMEQVGNLVIMTGVVSGIHEIEVVAAGYVAVVLVVLVTIADDIA
jgi:hypothetical protein